MAGSTRLAGELRGALDPAILQLLYIVMPATQLAEKSTVTGQVSGADCDKIGFRGLQELLDLLRHRVVALAEQLVEQRLQRRIFARRGRRRVHRLGVAGFPRRD